MVTSTATACGIADYARDVRAALRGKVAVEIVPIEETPRIPPHAEVVHLQYEHGFFLADDDPAGNLDGFLAGITQPVLITLHCLPLDDRRWLRWLAAPHVGYHVHSDEHARKLRELEPGVRVWRSTFPIAPRVSPTTTVEEVAAGLGLAGRRVLAMFGFLKAHKGFDVALEALAMLPEDVVLVLAGGPQDAADELTAAELREQARRLGLADRLLITGYLPAGHVGPTLAAADLVLAPFHTVTGSASVATALAWERPVLGSDLPQLRELRDRFGCLECVAGNDPGALADGVRRLLHDAAACESLREGARAARRAASFEALAADCLVAYQALRTNEAAGR